MEYTTLGKTGLKISRMGFGGIPIQRIDAEGTKKLMQQLAEDRTADFITFTATALRMNRSTMPQI